MKAVLHYVFLVGIPVIIVLVILQVGERTLTAPISVHGGWDIAFSPSQPAPSCQDVHLDYEDPVLTISQSGPHLVIYFDDLQRTTFKGNITQSSILAHAVDASGKVMPDFSLAFQVDRSVDPDQLSGTLTAESCEEAWAFTATRQPVMETSSGGH
ncbi:MAG: hypothetical protein Fur0022_06710 [Anaerolineales bacterium]